MDLSGKLAYLKSNAILKCMNKREVLDEHAATWRTNGLRDLQYAVLARGSIGGNERASKVTVDVQLNNHWTDQRSGIEDTQLP